MEYSGRITSIVRKVVFEKEDEAGIHKSLYPIGHQFAGSLSGSNTTFELLAIPLSAPTRIMAPISPPTCLGTLKQGERRGQW